GDLPEAERLAGRAWEIVRRQGLVVAGDEARQAFGASHADYGAELASCQVALGKPAAAFATLEEGRAQALLQLLFERQQLAAGGSASAPEFQAARAASERAEAQVTGGSLALSRAEGRLAAA